MLHMHDTRSRVHRYALSTPISLSSEIKSTITGFPYSEAPCSFSWFCTVAVRQTTFIVAQFAQVFDEGYRRTPSISAGLA